MLNPKTLGYIVIIYVAVLFASGGMAYVTVSLFLFAPPLLIALPILLLVTYLIGGAGLVFRRIWGSMVVILTTGVHLLLYAFSAVMMFTVNEDFRTAVTLSYPIIQAVAIFVPPAVIGYLALRSRMNPNAWHPSLPHQSGIE